MLNADADAQQSLQLALQHHQAGNLSQAEALYRQILVAYPRHPDALHLLGVVAKQTGHREAAVELMTQAIHCLPNFPEAFNNLGTTLADLTRWDEAIICYRKAIALLPNYTEAYFNLGNALKAKGQLNAAISHFQNAIILRPEYGEAYNNLGLALKDIGRLDDAIATLNRAIACKPHFPEPYCNLGNALHGKGRILEAIDSYRKSIAIAPNAANAPLAWSNLGNALREIGRLEEAIASCRKAIELKPNYPEAYCTLGNALTDAGSLNEAIVSYQNAIALKPDYTDAYNNLATAQKDAGRLDESIACYRRAVALQPDFAKAHSNLINTLHFHPDYDAMKIYQEHVQWNRQHAEPLRQFIQPHTNDRDPARRLRIGYVSPDFRQHPVGRFMLPILEQHDRRQLEIFCYASQHQNDDLTERLIPHADTWRDVAGLDDAQLADLIRRDRIDILVDLALHTAGNRLLAFARKPAPVQVTYLAYCAASGMETMDYRLADPYLDPPGLNEAVYSEKTVHLPDTYWCYQPPPGTPDPSPLPALRAGHITFGSLNNFCKISPPVVHAWCRLLKTVENSRLVLHADEGSHRRHLSDLLATGGIDAARLSFVSHLPIQQYFEKYREIDIALDPFPYPGGTTTCDALWMGVPVVSLAGQTAVSRGGLSILSNVGLPELVAHTPEEYLEITIGLANDLPRLADLRSTLRGKMQGSPLMDAPRFARNMEEAYRTMWRKWCASTRESENSTARLA